MRLNEFIAEDASSVQAGIAALIVFLNDMKTKHDHAQFP